MIIVVDYGAGNPTSIVRMLQRVGYHHCKISSRPDDLFSASKIILPGVGHFDYGMQQLRKRGFVEALSKLVLEEEVPLLGICLGAQLMTRQSEEGSEEGLGFISGNTIRFRKDKLPIGFKIPHMGWNDVNQVKSSSLLLGTQKARFYFVHSFHIVCDHDEDVLLSASYGYDFVAAFEVGNLIGVQFHPEKSHRYGKILLENFTKM